MTTGLDKNNQYLNNVPLTPEIKMKNPVLCTAFVLLLISVSSCKAAEKELAVGPGKTIIFDYAAGFDNGTLFDTTFEVAAKEAGIYDPNRVYQPVTLVYGRDPLFPGLQEALLGMKIGEIKNLRIPPNKAYGEKIEGSTATMPKEEISNYNSLKINDIVTIAAPDGSRINAYVRGIGEENVTLDLNHPLAGQYVQFSVILISIE